MEFANIATQVTRTEEYADSEPAQRGTWFSMLCYCCSMENSGRIADCRDWKSRKWEQMMGVTKAEAESDSKLWQWDGNDIVVTFYPHESEAKVKARSTAGRLGGLKSGLVRAASSNPGSKIEAPSILLQAKNEAPEDPPKVCLNKTEGNGTEPNQTEPKEREGNVTPDAPAPPPTPTPPPPTPPLPSIERCRQLIDYLNPVWSKLPRWGSEDEHALSECLPNLEALEPKDWQILAYFLRFATSAANTQARDPEKVTSKRSAFINDLSSYLDRATKHYKSCGSPAFDIARAPVAAPPPAPVVPEFASPAERAAYYRSLLNAA